MDLGVVWRDHEIPSLATYRDQVLAHLGVDFVRVAPAGDPPAGTLWDPGAGMRAPPPVMHAHRGPRVATVHGLTAFSVPPWRLGPPWQWPHWIELARRTWTGWRRLARTGPTRMIAVSDYGAREVRRVLGDAANVTAIPHGVDHDRFTPDGPVEERQPYLFHISHYQGVKNVHRIVAAWRRLQDRPDLVIASRGFRPRHDDPRLTVLDGIPEDRVAPLYRGAMGFVFPSHWESFGFPIVEAMACGTPVVTSTAAACPDTAGGAALLVDPRDTRALRAAMQRLVDEQGLRHDLRRRGLSHAATMTWQESARKHAQLFEDSAA